MTMLRPGPGGKGGGRSLVMVGGGPGQGQSRGNNCGARRRARAEAVRPAAKEATVLIIAPGALSARRRPAGPRRDDGGKWGCGGTRRQPGPAPLGLALFFLLGLRGIPSAQAAQRAPGPGRSACTRVVLGESSTVHVHYTYMRGPLRELHNNYTIK